MHDVLGTQFGTEPMTAVVIGASGGIGAQVTTELLRHSFINVVATSRSGEPSNSALAGIQAADWHSLNVTNSENIVEFGQWLKGAEAPPVRLVFCAMGLLHDGAMQPEKRLAELEAEYLHESFAVNAVGPMLVARELLPLMPRKGRVIFSSLSARVGSIGDNRLGGWYGYRASKAALNQFIKTMSIEWRRRAAESIAVALHPGTVDTPLSMPFQRNVPPGKLFSRQRAADQLLSVLAGLKTEDSGKHFAWDGQQIPW